MVELYSHQLEALDKLKNGCILCGGVGSGKSITAIAYYYLKQGGSYGYLKKGKYKRIDNAKPLYIITTARKRDTFEWEKELQMFNLSEWEDSTIYKQTVVVDSWNNIKKYADVNDAFFIFDEQRVIGYGAWTKAFLKITKVNEWILLSATPGDTWSDYIPVFVANGFYKNKTQFEREHIIYNRFCTYPQIDRYTGIERLNRLRARILVDMPFKRLTVRHHIDIPCKYDRNLYTKVMKHRWNVYKDEPCVNASEHCQTLRHVVNGDESRKEALQQIFESKCTCKKMIVFYNYNYELDILRSINFGDDVMTIEWNGQQHDAIPSSGKWVYLVQYTAGCEGWNCTKTDTIVFYSQNYSWKVMEQACGRIDRLNTTFTDLYYYHFKSDSQIDRAIERSIRKKKIFNESAFLIGTKKRR